MNRERKDSPQRRKRAAIALETMKIVDRGNYHTEDGTEVKILDAVDAAKSATCLYNESSMPPLPKARFEVPCEIEVTNESTVAAIQRSASDKLHIGCLNFASAKNPGGGFLRGSQAQEEALSRASALVPCLETQMSGYYEPNRASKSALYLDLAIASPMVPFFRDEHERLLPRPVSCTVITSPAPNSGAVLKQDPHQVDAIDAALVRRANMILHIAALHRVDVLVLGAWGCGDFRNKPTRIAQIFLDLLRRMDYQHHFHRIIFAVLDKSKKAENFEAFAKVFG